MIFERGKHIVWLQHIDKGSSISLIDSKITIVSHSWRRKRKVWSPLPSAVMELRTTWSNMWYSVLLVTAPGCGRTYCSTIIIRKLCNVHPAWSQMIPLHIAGKQCPSNFHLDTDCFHWVLFVFSLLQCEHRTERTQDKKKKTGAETQLCSVQDVIPIKKMCCHVTAATIKNNSNKATTQLPSSQIKSI